MIADPPGGLALRLAGRGGEPLVVVAGEIDLSNAHLLTDLVQQLARDNPGRVVLDLAGVTFFGADGVRALLLARDAVTGAGGRLALRAPSARVRRILAITLTAALFVVDG